MGCKWLLRYLSYFGQRTKRQNALKRLPRFFPDQFIDSGVQGGKFGRFFAKYGVSGLRVSLGKTAYRSESHRTPEEASQKSCIFLLTLGVCVSIIKVVIKQTKEVL